ncbi:MULTISPECIES: helix-turn-helix transcriptional regulator [unclassified Lysinibacillus]|uniref:helix-turn-helix transcriptional regulator n=1 Tax=unclassified Lysinibacillus TaxID=2636778 RepID=UPI0025528697|nr:MULTISPECIES: helix-turn-helix transcriptional regulator [unclassified Lysinibacillus]MDM5249236.1 helix-turn-helix transcriptional regulator [Lysinibacillus sp. G4S2]
MNREQLITLISEKLKLIRTEKDLTQDQMSELLGLSKKTLVQIEKGRTQTGWTTAVAVCALCRESSILQHELGGDPLEVVDLIANNGTLQPKEKTMGGYIWWKNLSEYNGYRLQQNAISQHFRILDTHNYRLLSTFDESIAKREWENITG